MKYRVQARRLGPTGSSQELKFDITSEMLSSVNEVGEPILDKGEY